jgi:hypothetical protein
MKQKQPVRRDDHNAMIDRIAGIVLTKLGGWPARIAGHDLGPRRSSEALVCALRTEMSKAATKLADETGEPALDDETRCASAPRLSCPDSDGRDEVEARRRSGA